MQRHLPCSSLEASVINDKDMMVIRFRSSEEHSDLLKKVKRMRMFTEELQDMLEECADESLDYRDDEYHKESRMEGRYGYRRRM